MTSGEEVVLTASKRNGRAVMRLERKKREQINMTGVHHVAGGPYKGILINKVAEDIDNVAPPEARMEFLTYIHKRDVSTDVAPIKDLWELKFWFHGRRADGLTRKKAFTEYFQELVSAKNLPKNYIGFVKRALVLLQKSQLIQRVEMEVEERDGLFPEELPSIQSFVSVFTPDNYCYQHVPEVSVNNKTFLTFKIKAAGEAYLSLAAVYGDLERKTYEVVLGAEENTKSLIRDSSMGPIKAEAHTVQLLSEKEFRYFWVAWENHLISVGRGPKQGHQTFLKWKVPMNRRFHVNCLAVSTSRMGKGQWEFAEILEEHEYNNKDVKRAKMKFSLLWLAKKQRMLQLLEDAYPETLPVDVIFKKSVVKHSDNITAAIMLKDMQKKGLIKEVAQGIWIRMQTGAEIKNHAIEIVKEIPVLSAREQPTVAIITALFEEKLAVDSMIEDKRTFIRFKNDGDSQVYTLGKIGRHRVVSTKLSRKGEGEEAHIASENSITRLLGTFSKVEHALLVGVGGAVPHYTDHTKHVRLGDVVVSTPQDSSGSQYIFCQKVEKIPHTVGYSYMTRVWGSRDQSLLSTVKAMRQQVERHPYDDRPWDPFLEQGKDILRGDESSFHRPPISRDRLFFTKPDGSIVQCNHPRPRSMYGNRGFKEGQVTVRYGLIGSGRIVARADDLRKDFAQLNGVKAFDQDYFPVLESLEGNGNDNFLVIRGCCDYIDGVKKEWRPYAALAAASVMKAIVEQL